MRTWTLFYCLALIFPLGADEITTRRGKVYRGEILYQDSRKLRVNLGAGQIVILRNSEIDEIKKEPLADTLLYLGTRELKRHQINRSVQTLLRAYQHNSQNKDIQMTLAQAQMLLAQEETSRRHPENAHRLLKQALTLDPQNTEIQQFLHDIQETITQHDHLEKRALTLHIQGQWQDAYHAFKNLLKADISRGPKIHQPFAETLVALGDQQLLSNQWILARDYYDEALVQDPDIIHWIEERWVTSHLEPVHDLLARGQALAILDEINRVLKVVPQNSNALYYRGIALLQLERIEEAKKDFLQILAQKNVSPLPEDVWDLQEQARKFYVSSFELLSLDEIEKRWEQSLPGDWQKIEGSGWVLHHHNNWIAKQLALVIDDALVRITQELTGQSSLPALTPAIELYIYRNEQDYLKAAKVSGWAAGLTRIQTVNQTVLSRKILSYQTAPQLVRGTIPHELAHILFPLFLETHNHLPHWLNEGVATRFEPDFKKTFYRNFVTQHAAAGTHLPLKEILQADEYPSQEEGVKLFYAQSFLLVDHLIETQGTEPFIKWAKNLTSENSLESLEQWLGPLETLEESLFNR